jgi:hypothetical protein
MYRKAQHMLMVVALTMSMLLVGIGPAQASENRECIFGILFCFDEGSSNPEPVSRAWFDAFMDWVNQYSWGLG